MKTVEEILALASTTIAHMHNRTGMYVSSKAQAGAAETLDGMLWLAHWFWASVQDRETEFGNLLFAIRQRHNCNSFGFPEAFRLLLNPGPDEEATFRFVLACWRELDAELGIDISLEASRQR